MVFASRGLTNRALLRQSCRSKSINIAKRHASTQQAALDVAAKGSESAAKMTSKASEGLSKVSSAAGPAISGAAQNAGNAVKSIGGRTGKLVGFVESKIPPTIYYSKVGLELGKLVFRGQKMSPPDLATLRSFYDPLLHVARNPTTVFEALSKSKMSPERLIESIKNIDRQQLVTISIVGAELLGFFTLGEIAGRMKLVGYRTSQSHGEDSH